MFSQRVISKLSCCPGTKYELIRKITSNKTTHSLTLPPSSPVLISASLNNSVCTYFRRFEVVFLGACAVHRVKWVRAWLQVEVHEARLVDVGREGDDDFGIRRSGAGCWGSPLVLDRYGHSIRCLVRREDNGIYDSPWLSFLSPYVQGGAVGPKNSRFIQQGGKTT